MAKIAIQNTINTNTVIWFKDGCITKQISFAGTLTEAYNKLQNLLGKVSVITHTTIINTSLSYMKGSYTISVI